MSSSRTMARAALLVSANLAMYALGACNILTPIAYIAEGPPKLPAKYTLPERKTAIFVDDRTNTISRSRLRDEIGDAIATALLTQKLVPDVVSPRDAHNLARNERAGQHLSMERIARDLGAEQLIYVEMMTYRISLDGVTPKPAASARVRVIDAVAREALFPSGTSGELVQSQMREVAPDRYGNTTGRRQIEDELAVEFGTEIAELFYDHEKRELGAGLGIKP